MTKKLTDAQALENAKEQVKHLRQIRQGFLAQLDEFTTWVVMCEDEIKKIEAGEEAEVDARFFSTGQWAQNVIQRLDDVSHVHTGSTQYMYVRQARNRAIRAASGDILVEEF